MDERILKTFEEPVSTGGSPVFLARIAGRSGVDGRWEAWVEFVPEGGGPILRSRRETTQRTVADLERWAQGLSRVYIEGSLARTLELQEATAPRATPGPPSRPYFDGPAPDLRSPRRPTPDDVALNPMLEYLRGELELRSRIRELAPAELRAIARAYRFDEGVDLDTLDHRSLEDLIVASARTHGVP